MSPGDGTELRRLRHAHVRPQARGARARRGMAPCDDDGREYLDFLGGIGVISLGHCHPAVVGAPCRAGREALHVSNYFYIEHRGEVARRISGLLNADGRGQAEATAAAVAARSSANSGAEANECAIKVARLHARKRAEAQARAAASAAPRVVVSARHAASTGARMATLAATGPGRLPAGGVPAAARRASPPFGAQRRGRAARGRGESGALPAAAICAVMVECVQGEGGVHGRATLRVPASCTSPTSATRRATRCSSCDEVQTGVFRCGSPFSVPARRHRALTS